MCRAGGRSREKFPETRIVTRHHARPFLSTFHERQILPARSLLSLRHVSFPFSSFYYVFIYFFFFPLPEKRRAANLFLAEEAEKIDRRVRKLYPAALALRSPRLLLDEPIIQNRHPGSCRGIRNNPLRALMKIGCGRGRQEEWRTINATGFDVCSHGLLLIDFTGSVARQLLHRKAGVGGTRAHLRPIIPSRVSITIDRE